MARRDNRPKRNKTKASLPNNIEELVNKAHGSPRAAFIKSMERLQKRIQAVERDEQVRVDIEQLPEYAQSYILYGVLPKRIQRAYIRDIEAIRKKDLSDLIVDQSFWEEDGESSIDTGYTESPLRNVQISTKELDYIRSILENHRGNVLNDMLLDALEQQIETDGTDEVAIRISVQIEKSEALASLAHKYRANTEKGMQYLREFKSIITGVGLTFNQNADLTEYNEELEGEDYL